MSRYTVIGVNEDFEPRRLIFYDPMVATQSVRMTDLTDLSEEFVFDSLDEAAKLADRLIQMDRIYWPPFGPVVAEVEAGRVTTLLAPTEVDEWIEGAARRWCLPVVVLSAW